MTNRVGKLLVIAGPSGAGKTSVIERLRQHPSVQVSVSLTTRPMRPGEVDGHDYSFVTRERFEQLHQQGAFVETNDVFGVGNLYGSLKSELDTALSTPGKVHIMEVDVVGARNIRRAGYDGLQVFIAAPSPVVLETRLRDRGTDDEAAIAARLGRAAVERQLADQEGATIIINHDIEDAAQEILRLVGLTAPAA
ncbi:MAG: guanylate kinase [Planctomycetota bacterium]|nr:MAG: guanylate kinase [Planctomycetota bacterium]